VDELKVYRDICTVRLNCVVRVNRASITLPSRAVETGPVGYFHLQICQHVFLGFVSLSQEQFILFRGEICLWSGAGQGYIFRLKRVPQHIYPLILIKPGEITRIFYFVQQETLYTLHGYIYTSMYMNKRCDQTTEHQP
jgi:hypothetical protein